MDIFLGILEYFRRFEGLVHSINRVVLGMKQENETEKRREESMCRSVKPQPLGGWLIEF